MLGDPFIDVEEEEGKIWKIFFCPGCNYYHGFQLNQNLGVPFWSWNGNNDLPTFEPSMLIKFNDSVICHLTIKDGMIHYHSDTQHEFKNLCIPMCEA